MTILYRMSHYYYYIVGIWTHIAGVYIFLENLKRTHLFFLGTGNFEPILRKLQNLPEEKAQNHVLQEKKGHPAINIKGQPKFMRNVSSNVVF